MLTHNPLIAFIPTKDTTRARHFYENILGLRFLSDDSFAIVMDANGTMVRIVRVEDFSPFPFTLLGWQVDNIHKTIAEMTSKGLQFTRYPYFEQSPDGVWTAPGGAKVAWFTDPDGNPLHLAALKAQNLFKTIFDNSLVVVSCCSLFFVFVVILNEVKDPCICPRSCFRLFLNPSHRCKSVLSFQF